MSQIQTIQYEGDNATFIWKHPTEDFRTGTQLFVHESQEAILFLNGQALDLFGPGRHELETQRLPLLTKLFNRPSGSEAPFHAAIYFINRTEQMAIKWGTDSRVEYIDPAYNFPLQIGASGEMSLRVGDSRRLLDKLVGMLPDLSQQSLVQRFRALLMTTVKTCIAGYIRENRVSIFSVDEHLTAMSTAIHAQLAPVFAEYGLLLERFCISTVVKPEDDPTYRRFKDLHFRQYVEVAEAQLRQKVGLIDQQTETQRTVMEAEGIARKRALEGYTYQDERRFNAVDSIAAHDSVEWLNNSAAGAGVSAAIGNMVGDALGAVIPPQGCVQPEQPEAMLQCPNCRMELPVGAKFCPDCGAKVERLNKDEMICPKCGEKTLKGKFCMQCGAALANVCPGCGAELPAGAKFCLECGHRL